MTNSATNDSVTAITAWPENRECAACGHARDVHGAEIMRNGGYRCNLRGGCTCPGFTPQNGRRDA